MIYAFIEINDYSLDEFNLTLDREQRWEEVSRCSKYQFSMSFPDEVSQEEADDEARSFMSQLGFIENEDYIIL